MNGWLKLGLGVIASLLCCGCQGQEKKTMVEFPPANQLRLLTTEAKEVSGHAQSYRFSYHVPSSQKKVTLWQEIYRDGQLSTRQEALTLAHVDQKGYISLELSVNQSEGYQVTLQVEGLEKHSGALTFHLPQSQQAEQAATAQVTLPTNTLLANERQPLFGLKFSTDKECEALSREFLKQPEKHASELTVGDVVYLYYSEFITEYELPFT